MYSPYHGPVRSLAFPVVPFVPSFIPRWCLFSVTGADSLLLSPLIHLWVSAFGHSFSNPCIPCVFLPAHSSIRSLCVPLRFSCVVTCSPQGFPDGFSPTYTFPVSLFDSRVSLSSCKLQCIRLCVPSAVLVFLVRSLVLSPMGSRSCPSFPMHLTVFPISLLLAFSVHSLPHFVVRSLMSFP